MLINLENSPDIFSEIHNKFNQHKTNVIILAAADCDSVCTVKIITKLLRTETISYSIHPVRSYEHIAELNRLKIRPKLEANELHSLIMINCGATVNLIQMLFFDDLMNSQREDFKKRKLEMEQANERKKQEFRLQRRQRIQERMRNNGSNGHNSYLDDLDDLDDDEIDEMEDFDLDDPDELRMEGVELYDIEMEEIQFEQELQQMAQAVTLPDKDDFRVYVMDSHRPFNLSNVWEPNQIICLLQSTNDKEDEQSHPKPIGFDMFEREMDQGRDSDEPLDVLDDLDDLDHLDDLGNEMKQDSDADEDADVDEMGPPRKRRRLNTNASGANNTNGANDRSKKMSDRERVQKERAIRKYYKFSYYAPHTSGIAYHMARMSFKHDNEMLWLAILGLTEQFVHEKIDREQYNKAVMDFREEVTYCNSIWNPRGRNQRNPRNPHNANSPDGVVAPAPAANGSDAARLNIKDEMSYDTSEESVSSNKIVRHRPSGHIEFGQEYRFALMRHWTLFDSMYYCRYIATKLGVWTDAGSDKLKYWLAKMAIPLKEAQEPFTIMSPEFKDKLSVLIEQHAGEFSLDDDIRYGSFTRQHGKYQGSISAADMVLALTAVLEADHVVAPHYDGDAADAAHAAAQGQIARTGNNHNDGGNSGLDAGEEKKDENKENDDGNDDMWQRNFWTCADATEVKNQEILLTAVKLAMERQKEVVEMGTKLLAKKSVKNDGAMRRCVIDHKNDFQTGMRLMHLALFLMDAYGEVQRIKMRQNGRQSREKAFVLASYVEKNASYLVVGIAAKKHRGDVQKSAFGMAFAEATRAVGARVAQNSFEGSVIEVQKDDFKEWMANVHEHLVNLVYMN